MNHPNVPPAVLQLALLEVMAAEPRTSASMDATVKLADLGATVDEMLASLEELAESGYIEFTFTDGSGIRYVITDAGRRLVAPESSMARLEQMEADALERLHTGSPRTFPGDTAHCTPGHVRGGKPYIVPTVPGSYVVRHGADYLDRAGRVVTQGTAGELRTMIWAEAEAAISAHEASLACGAC